MERTSDGASTRFGRLFRTDDARIAAAYQCFVWSLFLRASWLAVDIGIIPGDERLLLLLPTLVFVPLADLLGCGAALTRPREARLLVMALAVALFWSRALLWPQACAPGWPPYLGSSYPWEADARVCQGIANGACVVILAAACATAVWKRRD